jgi:hypothetical protein
MASGAGLDAPTFSGQPVRSGNATAEAIARASERSMMRQTGHRSVQLVRWYIREGNLSRESTGNLGF